MQSPNAANAANAATEENTLYSYNDYNTESTDSVTKLSWLGKNPGEWNARETFPTIRAFMAYFNKFVNNADKPRACTLATNGWEPSILEEVPDLLNLGPVCVSVVNRYQMPNVVYATLRPNNEAVQQDKGLHKTILNKGAASIIDIVSRLVEQRLKKDPEAVTAYDFSPANILYLPEQLASAKQEAGIVALRGFASNAADAVVDGIKAQAKALKDANQPKKAAAFNRLAQIVRSTLNQKDAPLKMLRHHDAVDSLFAAVNQAARDAIERYFLGTVHVALDDAKSKGLSEVVFHRNRSTEEEKTMPISIIEDVLASRPDTPMTFIDVGADVDYAALGDANPNASFAPASAGETAQA